MFSNEHLDSDTPRPVERDGLLSNFGGVACLRGDLLIEQWLTHRLAETTGRRCDQGRVGPATTPGDPRP